MVVATFSWTVAVLGGNFTDWFSSLHDDVQVRMAGPLTSPVPSMMIPAVWVDTLQSAATVPVRVIAPWTRE